MKTNKSRGNNSEKNVQQIFADNGWWCTLLADKRNGQPFDLIACKNNNVIFADVKACKGNYFLTSRIEPNQHTSFSFLKKRGNDKIFIICDFGDEIKFFNYFEIQPGVKKIEKNEMFCLQTTLQGAII